MVDVSITISNIKGIRRDKMATLLNDFMGRLKAAEVCTTETKEDDYPSSCTQNVEDHRDQARQQYLRKRLRDKYMHSRASVVLQGHKQTQRQKQNNDKSRDYKNPPLYQAPKCAYNGDTNSPRKARLSQTSRGTSRHNQIDDTI